MVRVPNFGYWTLSSHSYEPVRRVCRVLEWLSSFVHDCSTLNFQMPAKKKIVSAKLPKMGRLLWPVLDVGVTQVYCKCDDKL